ncbi:hypothetical protein O181_023477 [Austropuccinia psidii MF-1]|uniref:Pericentrin/AKAP-450 centrosomal targeting domain-containing protein n=1 Tax=Austropuccinia psidii MF-1 TaxID=1389203 RepID=A0A9Q3GY25_9BASI|nr:hypothetical protein [Austropuccinia psidii MF-1]
MTILDFQILETPNRLKQRIQQAEELEIGLESLPPPPPNDNESDQSFESRPRDLYDVGISNITSNTPFIFRSQNTKLLNLKSNSKKSQPLISRNSPPKNIPSLSSTKSPITSTPAHLNQTKSFPWTYQKKSFQSLNQNQNQNQNQNHIIHQNLSPNQSLIPQNQEAHQLRENMVILTTSSSGTESDPPNRDDEFNNNSSYESENLGNLSKKSLGDLDLSELDKFVDAPDLVYSHSKNSKPSTNHSSQLQSIYQSPSAASHSSSQSTLIANSPNNDPPTQDFPIEPILKPTTPNLSSISTISSPGIARRDSPQYQNDYSIDQHHPSFSKDPTSDLEPSRSSSLAHHQSFKPELTPAPYRTQSLINDQSSHFNPFTAMANKKSLLLSNFKSAQSVLPLRSARRPHVPRHLLEVGEDTSELSAFPNKNIISNNDSPPEPLAETETDTTSHDLTTHPTNPHINGNTSFPINDKSHRFNGTKLNSFLHSLNTHLSEENQQMHQTIAENNKELQRLRQSYHSLQQRINQSDQLNQDSSEDQHNNHSTDLQDSYHNNSLFQRQINQLQSLVDERDTEIKELQDQLLNKATSENFQSLKQTFELKNEIERLRSQLATQEDALTKSKLKHIETSGQHASEVARLRAECQKAQDNLFQTQQELIHSQAQTKEVKDSFAVKIESLKTQIGDLMEEQDNKIAHTTSLLNEARRLTAAQAKELEQLRSESTQRQTAFETLVSVKDELSKVLNGEGDQSVGRSAQRRIRMLQSVIESVISDDKDIAQDASSLANQATEQRSIEIQDLNEEIEKLRVNINHLVQESSEKSVRVNQLEQALKESESTRFARENEVVELKTQVDLLEVDNISQLSTIKGLEVKLSQTLQSILPSSEPDSSRFSRYSNNNAELRAAKEEINRLKSLLGKPSDVVTNELQNLKIKALEAHRHELEERVGSLRHQASALISTPSRSLAFQSVLSMRTPKTPGQILGNMTSVMESDSADETIAPMLQQIHELQQQAEQLRIQLQLANRNIDDKLAKLAEAGDNAVKLSSEALAARVKAEELEGTLEKLIGPNGTILQVKERLSKLRCPECSSTFDANQIVKFRVLPESNVVELALETLENDTVEKPSSLKIELRELKENSEQLTKKVHHLTRELDLKNDQLELLESRINEDDHEFEKLEKELSSARADMRNLENELKKEQENRIELETSQQNAIAGKRALEDRLEQIEPQLLQVQAALTKAIEARDSMDAEIRALYQIKGSSDELSDQISQLKATIAKLETDNEALQNERSSLHRQITDIRRELDHQTYIASNSEKSYQRVQTMLEKQSQELSRLEDELGNKSKELLELQKLKPKLVEDAHDLRNEMSKLKTEAEDLRQELTQLKLNSQRRPTLSNGQETTKAKDEVFLCKKQLNKLLSGSNQANDNLEQRNDLDLKHNSESKGLLLRIRFLKLMYTRENFFRADLADQKRLLLVKLNETEIRNQAIQVALENFGLPISNQPGNYTIHVTNRSFKGIALAIRAICKLKILSKNWRNESKVKEKLKEAYRNVRGKEFLVD